MKEKIAAEQNFSTYLIKVGAVSMNSSPISENLGSRFEIEVMFLTL